MNKNTTNIAVLVSGRGSNLQAIIDNVENGNISHASVLVVVSDVSDAYALERAGKAGIDAVVVEGKGFENREDYDKEVIRQLKQAEIEFIVLAGFMRILSGYFVDEYAGKIVNIHPALLPAFKGAHGIRDAFEAGVSVTGVTVHFVTEELDSGPIILQEEVKIVHLFLLFEETYHPRQMSWR